MISRKTRASGLLCQLSRALPMTTADLVVVSEAHMQLGSHKTVLQVRNVCAGVVFYSIILIEKSPGVMVKICWIKGHFNRIIVVCNRVPISKHDLCSSIFLLADFTEVCQSIAQLNPDHSQSHVVLKKMIQNLFHLKFHVISLKSS